MRRVRSRHRSRRSAAAMLTPSLWLWRRDSLAPGAHRASVVAIRHILRRPRRLFILAEQLYES